MTPIHYILIVAGGIALIGIILWLTSRRAPTPVPSTTASQNGDVGVAIAGFGAAASSLIGTLVQNEVNNANREEETAAAAAA